MASSFSRPSETVLICTSPRSGSSFLSEALGSIGIGDPNEWFVNDSLNFARKEADLPPDASLLETIEAVMSQKTDAQGVFAVKVMWENFGPIIWQLRRENAALGSVSLNQAIRMIFPNPKFVFLYREDRLKQAISYVKAEQSDIWSAADPAAEHYDPAELSFQFDAIRYRVACIEDAEQSWLDFFERSAFEPLSLTYEGFTSAPERTLAEIAHLLGRPAPTLSGGLKGAQVRMSDGINRDWSRRYQLLDERIRRNESERQVPPLDPDQTHGEIALSTAACRVHRQDRWSLRVLVRNLGAQPWPCVGYADLRDSVALVAQLYDENGKKVGERESQRVFFEQDVAPGVTVEACVPMVAPAQYGNFRLELELDQLTRFTIAQATVTIEVIPTWSERIGSAYFPNAVETSWGWYHDPVFGYFNTLKFPWLFHAELGWIYCSGTGGRGDDYWFWDWKLGLLWTSSRDFPFLYAFERQSWLEYARDSIDPRRFHDRKTDAWIEVGRIA